MVSMMGIRPTLCHARLLKQYGGGGLLATGLIGEHQLQRTLDDKRDFMQLLATTLSSKCPKTIEIDIPLLSDEISLQGWIKQIYDDTLIMYRSGKIRGKDRVTFWINWLACCAQSGNIACSLKEAHFYGSDGCFVLARVPQEQAKTLLEDLVDLYHQGGQSPLKFFPETAATWMKYRNTKKTLDKFNGSAFLAGEGQELNFQRVCPDLSVHFSEFVSLSERILAPIDQFEVTK